jgi:hypothetical protein
MISNAPSLDMKVNFNSQFGLVTLKTVLELEAESKLKQKVSPCI